MSEFVSQVSDDSFEADVLKSEQPVLVDFWAEWCTPCQMMMPILADVAKEYKDKVKFVKLNIDESGNTAAKFGVRSIPTLILFKGGNVEATKIGSLTQGQLAGFLDDNI